MRKIRLLAFLLVMSSVSLASAQDTTAHRNILSILQQDIYATAYDAAALFTSPLRFHTKDWLITGAALGGTAAFFPADEPIRDFALRSRTRTLSRMMKIGTYYGGGSLWRIVGATGYLGGLVLGNEEIRTTGRLVFESGIFAIVVYSNLKRLFGRSRPYEHERAFYYRPLQGLYGSSLPSGHAVISFTLSTVLAGRIHCLPARVALYGLAGFTSLSRVYVDAHWTSDVVLGSAIGYFLGRAVVEMNETPAGKRRWELAAAPGGAALVLHL